MKRFFWATLKNKNESSVAMAPFKSCNSIEHNSSQHDKYKNSERRRPAAIARYL